MTQPARTASKRRRHPWIAAVAALVLVGCGVLVVSRATADRNWEQTWKDRVRVETPLGASKSYVMAWIDQNCEFFPFANPEPCVDSVQDVPMVELAGIDEDAASSYAVLTVRRKDIAADETDHMRIYYFFSDEGEVIGHYFLPFHELAQFERTHQLLATH